MKIIENVFDLSEKSLMCEPHHVIINEEKIEELSKQMIDNGVNTKLEIDTNGYDLNYRLEILKELVVNSINYCYWYGNYRLRPNDISSSSLYNLVDVYFHSINFQALNFEWRIYNLIKHLSINRFTLLNERKSHLMELCEKRNAEYYMNNIIRNDKELEYDSLFNNLIELFPGYGSDIFLKRASLFFIQLNRKFGWFGELMKKLFVPSDYQLPKVLSNMGCIVYSDNLTEKIERSELIPKNSLEEIQIRAATIKTCKILSQLTGWNACQIDTYLYNLRKTIDYPFHLTITTDY